MKKLKRLFPARAAMVLLLVMLTTVGAWAQEGRVKIKPTFIRETGCSGVGADMYMHDKNLMTNSVYNADLIEDSWSIIDYSGEEEHEITVECTLTGDEGKNIDVNYQVMLTCKNGQMIPGDVEKNFENNAVIKVRYGHPMMYGSQKFVVKEIELYIIVNEIPMPNGIFRSKDEKIDNKFLFSWKEQFKKIRENGYDAPEWEDRDEWWQNFYENIIYQDEHTDDWMYEENFFELWRQYFKRFDIVSEPTKYAWEVFSDWTQEKLLQGFGFTQATFNWLARYKNWRWGTRRISARGKVSCSDTRLAQHQEWRWNTSLKRIMNEIKSDLRTYKATKGSTIKIIADEGYRVGSIIFRDNGGNMPGCVEFESANNNGTYYKNVGYYQGRQVLVKISNFNGPSSEVTLKVTQDFLFPEMEVQFLKENYSEFEQETYEVKTAQFSLLRLKNYPNDYPLYTGSDKSDFTPSIDYKADDMSYFTGTFSNGDQKIEGSLSAAGPYTKVNDHYLYQPEDWGHAEVMPVKEGETNIWASMKPRFGYAAAPNVAKTHLIIRGQDPQLHFANGSAHISKLASQLGAGPELIRFTGNVDANVTFSSSNPEVVTVTKNSNSSHTLTWQGGYGTVVISASQPAKDKFTAGYASYELTVQKPMQESFKQAYSMQGVENLKYGDPYMPRFSLKDGDYYMKEGRDFTVLYRKEGSTATTTIPPTSSGTYEVLFAGKDIYNGTIVGGSFTIAKMEMADAGYTIDDIPDVHGKMDPDFVLRKDGVAIDHSIIGGAAQNTTYITSFSKEPSNWQPGDEITLTITANRLSNVGGSLSKNFIYSYDGAGTEADPYKINSAKLFNYLANEVNSGKDMKGLYFKQTANINAPAATIGSIDHPFAGVFDGNQKLITNATKAVFGRLTSDATVKNLRVIGTTAETGAVALWNEGTLQYNYFHSTNTALNGLASNSGSGDTAADGAVRIYRVACAAPDDMTCTFKNTAQAELNNAKYYKANTTVNVILAKKGHENDTPTFYLSIGSLTNAAEGNTGDNSLTVTTNDIDINVAYTPFIQNGWISLAQESFQYDGTAKEPAVTVNNGTADLAADDYTITYENNIHAGTAKVVVKGKGAYTGEVVKTFTITPRTDYTIAMDSWQEVKVMPEPVITCEAIGKTLVKDVDYVLAKCTGNNTPTLDIDPDCELTIQFVGNYSGQAVKTFKVHFWRGEGTAENPYQIENTRQLCRLSEESNWLGPRVSYLEAHYKLMNDLDMDGISFRPISDRSASENYRFLGTFDGNNKVISNLTISEGTNSTGLFGSLNGATIKNVILKNVTANVTDASKPTALLVGRASGSSHISNCVVQGTLPADSKVRFAIAEMSSDYMSNNYYHVDGKDDVVGVSIFGDILENDGAVGLSNFTCGDGVQVVENTLTYSNTYDLFGTAYHKNGSTATMNLACTTLTEPFYYAENGDIVKNDGGSYTLTFNGPAKIIATTGIDMADTEVTLSQTEYTFDPSGSEGFEPTVTVTYNGKKLTRFDDYDVTYSDNVNAGAATVTVTGKKMYMNSKQVFFSIAPFDLSGQDYLSVRPVVNNVELFDFPNILYNGEDTEKPAVHASAYVDMKLIPLVEGEDKDFTVTYTKADEVGTAYVTVSGRGNYTGGTTQGYTITDNDISKCTATCVDIPYDMYRSYTDQLERALKVVSPRGEVLSIAGGDFKLSEANSQEENIYGPYGYGKFEKADPLAAGAHKVVIEGAGSWAGKLVVDFNLITDIPAQTLFDSQDNDAVLHAYWGINVPSATIQDRVLYKDGKWNTICLPFTLTKQQLAASPLAGCTLMDMNTDVNKTGYDQQTGELTLYFDEVNMNAANDGDYVLYGGHPYLIKWEMPDGYVAYDGTNADACSDIVNPVFNQGVNFAYSDVPRVSYDNNVTFRGTVNPVHLYDDQHNKYFLGANNTLFYPKNSFVQLNAFRAYFEIKQDDSSLARELTPVFNFHFGDNTTGITTSECSSDENMVWYSLDGYKLSKKPTKKGLYIHNGHKTVIK